MSATITRTRTVTTTVPKEKEPACTRAMIASSEDLLRCTQKHGKNSEKCADIAKKANKRVHRACDK